MLQKLGFRLRQALPIPDAFVFCGPNGNYREMKIHKSGVESGANGRHRYGIAHSVLKELDDVVFFARDEPFILIVPANVLSYIFDSNRSLAAINPSNQWVVNIYFNRNGKQWLVPVDFDEEFALSQFAHAASF